jgi:hypothetical protein
MNIDKKEAIKEYKARKPLRGAYALRCTATGQVWVGSSPNLDAIRNRLWFSLRQGNHQDSVLQKEWNTYGEQAFLYEILEKLDDDLSPIGVSDLLKEKKLQWVAQLGARKL